MKAKPKTWPSSTKILWVLLVYDNITSFLYVLFYVFYGSEMQFAKPHNTTY